MRGAKSMAGEDVEAIITRFAGMWKIDRQIDDTASAATGTFIGLARLWRSLDGLAYAEEGELRLGDAGPLVAERRYFWQIRVPERVDVCFEDDRFFHSFNPGQNSWKAEHICTPDHYQVTYEFISPSRWKTEWQVAGPRKMYQMTSLYSR
jgi:hypothetical protein